MPYFILEQECRACHQKWQPERHALLTCPSCQSRSIDYLNVRLTEPVVYERATT